MLEPRSEVKLIISKFSLLNTRDNIISYKTHNNPQCCLISAAWSPPKLKIRDVLTLARHNHFLFSVQMVLMALDMAASALERGRRFEDVPQRTGTGLAARREVVQSGDELVALVVDVRQTLAVRHRLHRRLLITFALTFVGVQDLKAPG